MLSFYVLPQQHYKCEILFVAESEDAEKDEYGSDTLDSQSEFRSTISNKSRKFKPSVWVKLIT
jgi:hypothetical protein